MRNLGLALAATIVLGTTMFLATPAAGSQWTSGSCQVVAGPPFLYSVVIPQSSIQCGSPHRRLRIVTTLTRNGVEAASARRDCRTTDICWLTVDASAADAPGNQEWCTRAVGYVDSRFIGEATACEAEEF
jgi:hypothetical protein